MPLPFKGLVSLLSFRADAVKTFPIILPMQALF